MTEKLTKMVRHAMTMMVGTFASRILGLFREILTAAFFGASRQLDAFYVAYTLANLSRQLLAEGALSAAFVPVFSQTLQKEGRDRARQLARQATAVLLLAGILVVVTGIIFSPALVRLLAPGFDPQKAALATALTRFMFPFLLFISLAALAMGVLNSLDNYFIPAIAPALSNVVFILLVLLTARSLGIWSLTLGVLAGGICQFSLQWFWTKKEEVFLIPTLPRKDDRELKKMISLFVPYAAGLSLNQVNPIISRMLGSFLLDGAISVLNYANRIIQLPLGLFVIAISQAILPELSRTSIEEDHVFRDLMRDCLRFTLFIVLPATVGLIFISSEMVNILFFRGAFGEWAWHATSSSLMMYTLGLPGMACTTVLMRGLYAQGMPRAAMIVTLSSVLSNLFFSLLLMKYFSFNGLALATSLAFTVSAFCGGFILSRHLKGPLYHLGLKWIAKLVFSVGTMSIMILAIKWLVPFQPQWVLLFRCVWLMGVIIFSVILYAIITWFLSFDEWTWITGALKKRSDIRSQ